VELGLLVDTHKVFVTGHSLGAFVTNRVRVELGNPVAAMAPVSGELWMNTGGPVPGAVAPISVLLMNGSADASVLCCGMTTPYPEAPEDDTFNYWPTQNVCKQTTAALCSGGKVTTTSSKTERRDAHRRWWCSSTGRLAAPTNGRE
jgi:poly(3-hydroxybutyrate) depolymerase